MPANIEDHPLNNMSSDPPHRSALNKDTLLALAVVLVGVGLLVGGYIGISGTTVASDQLAYLASASLPGVGVLIAGAVLLARSVAVAQHRETERLRHQVDALISWLGDASSDAGPRVDPPT